MYPSRLKKKNEAIKDKIVRDIKNLFELWNKEENYYQSVKVCTFYDSSYIEYESNGNRNKTLSIKDHFIKIRSYSKNAIKLENPVNKSN